MQITVGEGERGPWSGAKARQFKMERNQDILTSQLREQV